MSPPLIKICGLSTIADVDASLNAGASHIGLVFVDKSPRNVGVELAADLSKRARGVAKVVGLFVNPDRTLLDKVRSNVPLDIIQLHGDETPAMVSQVAIQHGLEVWKAIPVRRQADLNSGRKFLGAANRILYDAMTPPGELPGGSGLAFDWSLLAGYRHSLPWILAGGLNPRNVQNAIRISNASFVDVSSGVESSRGIKDPALIAAFCAAARD